MFDHLTGIGVDICAISRIAEAIKRPHFVERVFTPAEREYLDARGALRGQSAAGLFAAKEAALKALGTGMTIPMTDIVISCTALGQPVVTLSGKAAELGGNVMISITHEAGMAAAFAVWTK